MQILPGEHNGTKRSFTVVNTYTNVYKLRHHVHMTADYLCASRFRHYEIQRVEQTLFGQFRPQGSFGRYPPQILTPNSERLIKKLNDSVEFCIFQPHPTCCKGRYKRSNRKRRSGKLCYGLMRTTCRIPCVIS